VYQKVYFEVDAKEGTTEHRFGTTEHRYVWLNLEIDMVDIGTSEFYHYKHFASAVKRLKFERKHSNHYFSHIEQRQVYSFANVEEIHIVCQDGYSGWRGCRHHSWPCAIENMTFIEEGRVARGLELEGICQNIMDSQEEDASGGHVSS
jgi:hypothetical protein